MPEDWRAQSLTHQSAGVGDGRGIPERSSAILRRRRAARLGAAEGVGAEFHSVALAQPGGLELREGASEALTVDRLHIGVNANRTQPSFGNRR
jgi:hypothetical protein